MSVYQVGQKYYVDVSDRKGNRIRRSVGPDPKVAQLVEMDLQVKIAKGLFLGIFEAVNTPFEEYALAWLEKKKKSVAKSTYDDYTSAFTVYAIPFFKQIPMCKLSARDGEDFREELAAIEEEELSGKRKNNIMVPLKKMFSDAVRRKEILENPMANAQRFRERKTFVDPLSIPEMHLFLEAVDRWYFAYFFTAFFTGARPNELLALKWLHVDLKYLQLISIREGRVQGKDGLLKTDASNRDVDILPPLLKVLQEHRAAAPKDATYVFTTPEGTPLDVNNLRNRVWYPTVEKAGLRKRVMYQARHTFASMMLANGEDPLWVSQMLGHTTLDMLYKHYGKFIRNRSRKDGLRFLQAWEESGKPVGTGMLALPLGTHGRITP